MIAWGIRTRELLPIVLLGMLLLTGCTTVQRGGLIGALIGSGAGAGIGAAGGGVGVAIGAGAGAGAGALAGGIAGEAYDLHMARVNEEKEDYSDATGEARMRTKYLAAYEKQMALMEARVRTLLAQNQQLRQARTVVVKELVPAPTPTPAPETRAVHVETTAEGVMQVSMVSEVLFEPGSAKLKEAIYPVLDEIGRTIGTEYPNYYVAIEGHSDAGEVAPDGGYRSEWELSAARALAVLHYFGDQRLIESSRMAVACYGPYRPATPASGPEAGRQNRRVVVTLMPQRASAAGL
jgi:flagellar motor protein MotB